MLKIIITMLLDLCYNKKSFCLLLALVISNLLFAQKKFKIELDAPCYINDTLIFAPLIIGNGFEELYQIKLKTSKNIIDFGKHFGFGKAAYQIIIKEKNIIEGEIDYPMPISIQFVNTKTEQIYLTSPFFLDTGYYKIRLPKMFNLYDVKINSPSNNEYSNFKKLFSALYLKPKEENNFIPLIDINEKEKRVAAYLKNNPNSYVALWEIIDDYVRYRYHYIYIDNLLLFSTEIKKTELFMKFQRKLNLEKMITVGSKFPNIQFDKENSLTEKDFKKYKLTFIDYWSTTCIPCIKAMPKMLEIYNNYQHKGINFITITAENEPKKIELANHILNRNNIKWTNFFDIHKEFKNKTGATAYPLQFLIDSTGKIILRVEGNLEAIKKAIDDNLK